MLPQKAPSLYIQRLHFLNLSSVHPLPYYLKFRSIPFSRFRFAELFSKNLLLRNHCALCTGQSGQPRVLKNFEEISCLCFIKNRLAVFFIDLCSTRPTFFAFISIVYLLYISRTSGLKKNTFLPIFVYLNCYSQPIWSNYNSF